MSKLDSSKRLITMLLDHFIMTFVIMIFAAPGMIYDMFQTFGNSGAEPKIFMGNLYLNVFAFSLYFNKDIYLGRSPAKRILKLQVIDIRSNRPAGPLKCLLRNVTIILWPIEAIVALINNERRIGDYLAGTKLAIYDSGLDNDKPNWVLVIVAILASMLITYLLMLYPMELLLNR